MPDLLQETGLKLVAQAASPPGRCKSFFQQLLREKSLVPKRSGISGNSSDISKGVSQNDISEFESCYGSQPVPSL
jgi:hypothetical protein